MKARGLGDDRTSLPWIGAAVALLVLLKLALHVATSGRYGYFRDELYYLACADHLAWGYVDHPPLSIAVLALNRAALGDTLLALRLPVALSGALLVLLSALLARELGAGRFGQTLAALAVVVTPVLLGISTFYSMNALDVLFWIGGALIVCRIINTGNSKLWALFGLVVGLGMLNKISVGFFVFGVVVGLLLTAHRRQLFEPWFWLGGTLAAVLFLPHVLWQSANGLPTLEFMRNASAIKIAAMSPGQYFGAQVLYTLPALPVWLAGLSALLLSAALRPYRVLGVAYVAILALLLVQKGKAYYLAPAYPILYAAGGVAWERFTRERRWWRVGLVVLTVTLGAVAAPMAVPLLAPHTLVAYTGALGIEAPQEERQGKVALSQHFADRFGWENLVATIARVHQLLPPEERAGAAIVLSNYGEAGAVDFFGPRFGLPRAISGHNNYWLWGPRDATGDVAIVVGARKDDLDRLFAEVTQADTIVSEHAMAYETNLPVYICRRIKRPLAEVWPQLKRYI